MKYLFPIVFTILFINALPVFSQDAEWLRIEFDNKKISAAIPQTNLIDAEKRAGGQRLNIVAFENGVEMEIFHRKSNFTPDLLSSINNSGKSDKSKNQILRFGDYYILKTSPVKEGKSISSKLAVLRDGNLFLFSVRSKTGDEKEVVRFFLSIKIEGQSLIVKDEKTNFPEETVSVSDLNSSPEVIEAEKRQTGKFEGKITYKLKSDEEIEETEDLTHRALIIDKPVPRVDSTTGFTGKLEPVFVELLVQLRADGQVGDIVVTSNSTENFTKNSINAARRIKFVPARRDDEFVDSFQIVKYAMIAVPTTNTIIR